MTTYTRGHVVIVRKTQTTPYGWDMECETCGFKSGTYIRRRSALARAAEHNETGQTETGFFGPRKGGAI